MSRFLTIRKLLLAAAVAAVGTVSIEAHAGGYGYGGGYAYGGGYGGGYQQNWTWKTVVVYETVEQPVVQYVTRYLPCGTPYEAKVVTYRTVRIPVEKQVKVYY